MIARLAVIALCLVSIGQALAAGSAATPASPATPAATGTSTSAPAATPAPNTPSTTGLNTGGPLGQPLPGMPAPITGNGDITDEYPELKKYLFVEPKSHFHFGFGINPIGVMKNKLFFSFDIFELHYINDPWDVEILSAGLGFGFAKDSFANSRHLTFRLSPKFKILSFLSVGPLVGYEFASFPDVTSRLNKDIYATPREPFSSKGVIYGAAFSETFSFKDGAYLLKISQSIYQQTYSTTTTSNGWTYVFDDVNLQNDPDRTILKPSVVFLFQLALLY